MRRYQTVAIFTDDRVFDNPYVTLGNNSDVCALCRQELLAKEPQLAKDYPWMVTMKLRGQLADKRIFKIFQNSNTPFVLCANHIHEIDKLLQEES